MRQQNPRMQIDLSETFFLLHADVRSKDSDNQFANYSQWFSDIFKIIILFLSIGRGAMKAPCC